MKIHHIPIVKQKGIQTNIVKAIIISIFTSNRTNTRKLRNSRGKKTEDVLGNFMKLSSLFDESNYHEQAITQQSIKTTPTIVMKTTHQSRTRENVLIFATK